MPTRVLVATLGLLLVEGCASTRDDVPISQSTSGIAQTSARAGAATTADEELAKRYAACWRSYNTHSWDMLRACYAPHVVQDEPDSGMPPFLGVERAVAHLILFAKSFPDGVGEPALTLVNNHRVASIIRFRGTNDGPFPNPVGGALPPTHRTMRLAMAHLIDTGADGKITKEWILYDPLSMLGQLGLLPSKTPFRVGLGGVVAGNAVVIARGDATERRNVAAWRGLAQSFNRHDARGLASALAAGLRWSDGARSADQGKPARLAELEALWVRFSDVKIEPQSVWGAGAYVVAVGKLAETNDGKVAARSLRGEHKRLALTFIEFDHFTAGKIDRGWIFYNGVALAKQLG